VRNLRVIFLALSLLRLLISSPLVSGQGTTQYIYDSNGRLTGVIAPNGEAAIYRYDPAGNLISIEHIGAGDFAVLAFTPQIGTIGDQITFTGVGLDTVSSISFNGTPAQIISATASSLTARVPDGASTGLITLSGVRGTTTTATPFTVVARVIISPALAEIVPGESVDFNVTVVGTQDQRVNWAVNGIAGGNASIGTIDATGLYQSPSIDTGLTVTINATSQLDTAVSAAATVRILNPNFSSEVRSNAVSVGLGVTGTTVFVSAPLSVQKGAPLGIGSRPVSVLEGSLIPIQSPALSVELGEALAISSHSVSIDFGVLLPLSGPSVSTTTGPVITSISPSTLTRGTTVTVTITGQNLSGTTKVSFNRINATLEPNVSVSNLAVSSDGMSLTFTAVVAANALTGNDAVYVSAPNGLSQTQDMGTNRITIQ
jgi:YD repeat-containing protein